MKASNKVLCTAGTAFLLAAIAASIFLHREYGKTKEYAQPLLAQLSNTRIRTLIVDSPEITVYKRAPRSGHTQSISLRTALKPGDLSIQGDTLYLRNQQWAYLNLQYLENYIVNGVSQPLSETTKPGR